MQSISVIIPVYNGAPFIIQALASVAGQSRAPLEVIVIDDGSTDNTAETVAGFASEIPVVYERQEHGGAGIARNRGVGIARGDWIAFLDADDIWHSDKLAIQTQHAEHAPHVPLFYSDVDLIDGSGALLRRRWSTCEYVERDLNSRQRLSRMIFSGKPLPLPSTIVMQRELFHRAGGFNNAFRGKYHEDVEFLARLAEIAPMQFIPQSLAQYRSHATRSSVDLEMDRMNWLLFLDCLWQTWQHAPAKQAQLISYFAKHYADEAKRLLRAGHYVQARRRCRLAAGYQPFSFTNLRHWGLTFLPGARDLYRIRAARRNSAGGVGTERS